MQRFKEYLQEFLIEFDYPLEAQEVFISAFKQAFSNAERWAQFQEVFAKYEQDFTTSFAAVIAAAKEIAKKSELNEYTVHLLVLILLSKASKKHYEQSKLSAEIWKRNFFDLKYKNEECKLVKGVWGTFCPDWFSRFFNLTRFSFEKLQFETVLFGRTYQKEGVALHEKSVVINVHIPRTGGKLTPESVDEACAQARDFYKKREGLSPIVFVCNSWLLYPENKKILPPTSNLHSFISRFEVLQTYEDTSYVDVWRLFDKDYNGNVDELPQNTSLRRAYAQKMKANENLGRSYGVWVYEK